MTQDTYPHTLDMKAFSELPPHAQQPEAVSDAEARRARRILGQDVSRWILLIGILAPVVFIALLVLADVL